MDQKDCPIRPIAFTDVQNTDDFWLPFMETNRKVTIPFTFKKRGNWIDSKKRCSQKGFLLK